MIREKGRKMRDIRVNVFCYLIVALLFLAPFNHAAGNVTNEFQRCDIHKAENQCGENERCFQSTKDEEGECRCELGYEFARGQCVQLTTTTITSITVDQPEVEVNSGGSSVAAGLLIPTFLIVMSVLLYFVARRYKWLQRVRHFRPNHYGNVLVTRDDDDDDDPPIP
ncbi:uncharacterized protein LOC122532286 isoform X4 [Frieseomelitta varia]|uniref:uncharacterized protein LOC122532286 isoform X4 n=1 Tax=Frieseomelitta varia TaxID=561572 RepID=UPI001CB6AE8B|nr:uncharacterized protein LOC122532286 isoform X4 [Frieseomelitta varia]